MKILWHSNAPWVPSGYGQQTAEFTPRIRDLGHDVAISAFWGLAGSRLVWNGMTVYPSAGPGWGDLELPIYAPHHGGDDCLVITLMDVWVLNSSALAKLRMASWVPVDHDPAPPRVIDFFARTGATPIAMSRFGQDMLSRAGLKPLYVPHGIDTQTFRAPDPDERAAMRKDMAEFLGVPEDAFLVGMVAANQGCTPPRKAFPQVFQAFARLRRERPDSYLYLHTELTGLNNGVNLGALAAAAGVPPEAIKFTPPAKWVLGSRPGEVAALMGAFDVLINPSYGEGFGIPIVEAQACGTPVIVTDFSAMRELCGSGWRVGGEEWYDATQGSFYRCPSVDELHIALTEAYERRGDTELREKARAFAEQYDAARVTSEFWLPTLEELERMEPVELTPERAAA